MITVSKSALPIGVGIAIFLTAAGLTSAVLHFQPSLLAKLDAAQRQSSAPATACTTIATDPSPPLNVRSSPVVAPDNIVGNIRNGTHLTVVDENEGWLRISQPLEGWVYKELTVKSCISTQAELSMKGGSLTPTGAALSVMTDDGMGKLTQATEYYQAGNLQAAIALAQTVPANSNAYQQAQAALQRWPQDWKTAEATFYIAQKAMNDGRWQDVLNTVKTFPDNQFWRGRLVPIVKAAIQRQNATT